MSKIDRLKAKRLIRAEKIKEYLHELAQMLCISITLIESLERDIRMVLSQWERKGE